MAEKEYIEVEPLKKQIADSKRYVRSNSTEFLIGYDTALSDVEKMISELPAADVQPVSHAKWLICSDGYYPYCSECKCEPQNGEMTNYCPNCGARMDGETNA